MSESNKAPVPRELNDESEEAPDRECPCLGGIITQAELDTLLASIEVAKKRRRPASAPAMAALYDFRHAARLSPDQMRLLQARLDVLAVALNRTMSLYLNVPTQFRVQSLDVMSTEQFLRNLAPQPVLGIISFAEGGAAALWELSSLLAISAVDCMLGGRGQIEETSGEVTPLERAVLRRFFQELLSAWGELWDRLAALRPQVERVVTAATGIDLRASEERLFSAVLDCVIGHVRGILRLCLPLGIVKRLLREERETVTATQIASTAARLPAQKALAQTAVPLVARLELPPLPAKELVGLQPGQILNLRQPINEPLTVCIGGLPKFKAVIGTTKGRLAVRLIGDVGRLELRGGAAGRPSRAA